MKDETTARTEKSRNVKVCGDEVADSVEILNDSWVLWGGGGPYLICSRSLGGPLIAGEKLYVQNSAEL